MKKADDFAWLLEEQNFETAQAIWQALNRAREQCRERFWIRLEQILNLKIPRGWTLEPKDARKSASWYHLALNPPRKSTIYSRIVIQQTRDTESWRLQWGVGVASTATEEAPELPRRGEAARVLDNFRRSLRSHNFQPTRGSRIWWVAKRHGDERLGDWDTIQKIAANDEIERRIASNLMELLDHTSAMIFALNRALS
jgi:hypothetical protein